MSANTNPTDRPEANKLNEVPSIPPSEKYSPDSRVKKDIAESINTNRPNADLETLAHLTPSQRKELHRQEIINRHAKDRASLMIKVVEAGEKKWKEAIPNKYVRGTTEFLVSLIPFVGSASQYLKGQATEHEALAQGMKTTGHLVKGEITLRDAAKMWSEDLHQWFVGKVDTTLGQFGIVLDALTLGEGSEAIRAVAGAVKEFNGVKVATEAGPTLVKVAEEVARVSPEVGQLLKRSGVFLTEQVTKKPLVAKALGKFVIEPQLRRIRKPVEQKIRETQKHRFVSDTIKVGYGKFNPQRV